LVRSDAHHDGHGNKVRFALPLLRRGTYRALPCASPAPCQRA